MAGCGATGQQEIAPAKEFLWCFVYVEELSKLERKSLHPDDF